MLSGWARSSFKPQEGGCCSHASAYSNEFLCIYEQASPVPSCWVLACVWSCSVAATARLNKQFGSGTGFLGVCAIGIPERMGMSLSLGGWESIQLLGNQLNLTNENCFFIWIAQAAKLFLVAAWQSSPAPDIWQAKCFPVSWLSPQLLAVLIRAITGFSGFSLVLTFGLRGGCYFQTFATNSW